MNGTHRKIEVFCYETPKNLKKSHATFEISLIPWLKSIVSYFFLNRQRQELVREMAAMEGVEQKQQPDQFIKFLDSVQISMQKKYATPQKNLIVDDLFVVPIKCTSKLVDQQKDVNRRLLKELQTSMNQHRRAIAKMKKQYISLQKGWFKEKQLTKRNVAYERYYFLLTT